MKPTLLLFSLLAALALAAPTTDNNNIANANAPAISVSEELEVERPASDLGGRLKPKPKDGCGDCKKKFEKCMKGCSWFVPNCAVMCGCNLGKEVSAPVKGAVEGEARQGTDSLVSAFRSAIMIALRRARSRADGQTGLSLPVSVNTGRRERRATPPCPNTESLRFGGT